MGWGGGGALLCFPGTWETRDTCLVGGGMLFGGAGKGGGLPGLGQPLPSRLRGGTVPLLTLPSAASLSPPFAWLPCGPQSPRFTPRWKASLI